MLNANDDSFVTIKEISYSSSNRAFNSMELRKSLLGHYIMELDCNFNYDRYFGHSITSYRLDLNGEYVSCYLEYNSLIDQTKEYDIYLKQLGDKNKLRIAFLKI